MNLQMDAQFLTMHSVVMQLQEVPFIYFSMNMNHLHYSQLPTAYRVVK